MFADLFWSYCCLPVCLLFFECSLNSIASVQQSNVVEFASQSNRVWLEMQIEKNIHMFCICMEFDCYKNRLGTVNVRRPLRKIS
jgi:hypothetical protein